MERFELKVLPREETKRRGANRLRAQGLVPAVVYGQGRGTSSVAVDERELTALVRRGARMFDLVQGDASGGKGRELAMFKEVQTDPFGERILHVDFHRIAADQKVSVGVPIAVRGELQGPVAGWHMDLVLHEIEVECLPTDIPAKIELDVRGLGVGAVVHVRDLALPAGVVALELDDTVLIVTAPAGEEAAEAAETETGGAPAEPELIGRKPKEEGEDE